MNICRIRVAVAQTEVLLEYSGAAEFIHGQIVTLLISGN